MPIDYSKYPANWKKEIFPPFSNEQATAAKPAVYQTIPSYGQLSYGLKEKKAAIVFEVYGLGMKPMHTEKQQCTPFGK